MRDSTDNQSVAGLSWKKLEADVPARPALMVKDHLRASSKPCTMNRSSIVYNCEKIESNRFVNEASKTQLPIFGSL
jgi:hypothetical protein